MSTPTVATVIEELGLGLVNELLIELSKHKADMETVRLNAEAAQTQLAEELILLADEIPD